MVPVPMPGARPPGTPIGAPRPLPARPSVGVAQVAQRVATGAAAHVGVDPRGPEYDAILKLSREVIERIAWEVVPELAAVIIKESLDKLKK